MYARGSWPSLSVVRALMVVVSSPLAIPSAPPPATPREPATGKPDGDRTRNGSKLHCRGIPVCQTYSSTIASTSVPVIKLKNK